MADPNISSILPISMQTAQFIAKEAASNLAKMVASSESLDDIVELSVFNPMVQAQKFKSLSALKQQSTTKTEAAENPDEVKILDVEAINETAERFQKNNFELNAKTLLILRSLLTEEDTPEEIMTKILSMYPDPALADEVLDFLLETADPKMKENLKKTKEMLNDLYERQVKAGRNIGALAREFSKEGLGAPTSLRDLYRDITGNPRDPLKLFNELAENLSYNKLKATILFLLHSLGTDLKAKGPSIERGELVRLIGETRSLQGILGVFRFFQSRTKLIQRQFDSYHLEVSSRINFESIAKLFVKILAERYMNPEKIIQTAKQLDISEKVAAQIIIYSQMNEAIKQVAPKYYRNPQHQNELTKAFLDTLEQLEDKLEEEEEEKKEKEKKKKKDQGK